MKKSIITILIAILTATTALSDDIIIGIDTGADANSNSQSSSKSSAQGGQGGSASSYSGDVTDNSETYNPPAPPTPVDPNTQVLDLKPSDSNLWDVQEFLEEVQDVFTYEQLEVLAEKEDGSRQRPFAVGNREEMPSTIKIVVRKTPEDNKGVRVRGAYTAVGDTKESFSISLMAEMAMGAMENGANYLNIKEVGYGISADSLGKGYNAGVTGSAVDALAALIVGTIAKKQMFSTSTKVPYFKGYMYRTPKDPKGAHPHGDEELVTGSAPKKKKKLLASAKSSER